MIHSLVGRLSPVAVATVFLAFGSTTSHAQSGGAVVIKLKSADPTLAAGAARTPGQSRMPTVGGRGLAPMTNGTPRGTPGTSLDKQGEAEPLAFGSLKWPYAHSRVAVQKLGPSDTIPKTPVTSLPYRLTGASEQQFGASLFVCSASLILPGLLVTAAHCVSDFGQGSAGGATAYRWYPANISSAAAQPFGTFTAAAIIVPSTYLNGTDTCLKGGSGVVCNNDLAIVVLNKLNNKHAGEILGGEYGYGWNNSNFVSTGTFGVVRSVAQITELGYPVAFDSGFQMQRTESLGLYLEATGTANTTNGKLLKQTRMGSPQTGGASGGPWFVNFGTRPVVDTTEASLGSAAGFNTVVGVSSYKLGPVGANVIGSSAFGNNAEYPQTSAQNGGRGAGNIGFLVKKACTDFPDRC